MTTTALGNTSTSGSTPALTITNSIGSGDAVVVCVMISSSTVGVSSIKDGSANTYSRAIYVGNNDHSGRPEIWHCLSATALASSGVITVTLSGSASCVISADKIVGGASYAGSGSGTGHVNNPTETNPTVTMFVASGSVAVGAVSASQTLTQPTGIWTSDVNSGGQSAAHGTTSGSGATYNPVMSSSGDWAAVIAGYSGGASAVVSTRGLLF